MARKKRRFDQIPAAKPDTGEKPRHQDAFQRVVGQTIEDAGKKLEGQGRNLLYGAGAAVVLGAVIWIGFIWMNSSNSEAQTALGKAIETSQAPISDLPVPAGSTIQSFKTRQERAEAAIKEFNVIAVKYGGSVGSKAKYFAAVNRLILDREAGIKELEALKEIGGPTGTLVNFALAQTLVEDGKMDEAEKIYKELAGGDDAVISRDTINLELAKLYEKQGKREEATTLLFDIVKTASEAKDMEGRSVPLSSAAQAAKELLEEIDPAKAKEIPNPLSAEPLGDIPF